MNDLAQFMVSSTTAQLGIVKRAKNPTIPPIIRYKDVRKPIVQYLTDPARSLNPLIVAEQTFLQRAADTSESSLRQDDALKSVEVLHAIHGMANSLGAYAFHPAPAKQGKLVIAGVDVSVHADLLLHGVTKGVQQMGAAVLRMTQADTSSDAAVEKRKQMGLYVATLVRLHVDQNLLAEPRVAANKFCMSIDVQHGEVFVAPASSARRINDLTAACQMIAALWASA